MQVILLQDIENLGKKYEVKEVRDGYARNFLIPKGLVKLANKAAMKWLKIQKEIETQKAEKELKSIQSLASQLDGLEITISVKVGEEKQLFESIDVQKILKALKEKGFKVKKEQIKLEEPIKELGEYPVRIHLEHNLEAEIGVIVTEEKS